MKQAILTWGNPHLLRQADPVINFSDDELKELINDMHDTMLAERGVGIAAPQIGSNLQVIMFGYDKPARYPNEPAMALTVLVNPTYEPITTQTVEMLEGCLSVPGLRGPVARYAKIRYSAYNEHGELVEGIAENLHARVIQHESDHLKGILFPFLVKDLRRMGFEKELLLNL